jgi:tyrosyl-tRNA synthetase
MSISDELMWRYYELLTDLRPDEITQLRASTEAGERNPRDLKVELAKRIITDFHSSSDAQAAEDEFNRIFRRKETPEAVEEHLVKAERMALTHLLVEVGAATSKAEARRLIEQGGVTVDGERCTVVTEILLLSPDKPAREIKVGKRRFLRVRGV